MTELVDGAEMTRAQALQFNLRWDERDRAILDEEFNNRSAARFSFQKKGYNEYVRVACAAGNPLMHVSKGTIYFGDYNPNRPGTEWSGRDFVLRLSTHRAGGATKQPKAEGETCTRCFQQMSLTGACGNCD